MTVMLEDLAPVYDMDGNVVKPGRIWGHRIVRPCIIQGKVVPDYYIDLDGDLWSTKNKFPEYRSPNYNKRYPMVGLRVNGEPVSIEIHNLVCQTWYNKPYKPNCISDADWEVTPEPVRRLCDQLYEAHHIDHDTHNHNPGNMEWLTKKENRLAWIAHRKKSQEEDN